MVQLRYDITPVNTPRFAADIVALIEKHEGVTLDYSVDSLIKVDGILGGWHEEGTKSDDIAATLFGFGCYVGEVFVRHAGGVWRGPTAKEEEAFDMPLVLELKHGTVINPIGKVFKRVDLGIEDNLPYFYAAFSKPCA